MSVKKIILGALATILIVAGFPSDRALAATLYLDSIRCVENAGANSSTNYLHFYYFENRDTNQIAETASYTMQSGETCSTYNMTNRQDSEIENLPSATLQKALDALGSNAPAGSIAEVGEGFLGTTTSGNNSSGGSNTDTDADAEGGGTDETADPVEERCTSILPSSWCTEDGDGIAGILNLILDIMTAGMGILATIGLVISGIQWLTARDKEDQVVKAKSRIFNIVIGIMVWGIMWLVLQWLLPGGINLEIGAII